MSIPGVGPVIATAVAALAPPAETFKRGRDLRLGSGSRHCNIPPEGNKASARRRRWESGRCDVCFIIGASSVVRWAARKGAPAGSWLASMIARKPAMLVRVALANKMAPYGPAACEPLHS